MPTLEVGDYILVNKFALAPHGELTKKLEVTAHKFSHAARERIVADLEAQGLLEKIVDHRLMVPRGDRSGAVIEPFLTDP